MTTGWLPYWTLKKVLLNSSDPDANAYLKQNQGFPGSSAVKNLPAKAGDTGSIPGLGRPHMPQGN